MFELIFLYIDTNINIITKDSGQTKLESSEETNILAEPSTFVDFSILDQQQQKFCSPKITVSVPHEKLTATFDFMLSKRFKFALIIVLTGTTIFVASMIVLGYWLNKRFYDDIMPGPCGLLPCTSSTETSSTQNFI